MAVLGEIASLFSRRGAPKRAPLFVLAISTPGESAQSGDGGWPPPALACLHDETTLTLPMPATTRG